MHNQRMSGIFTGLGLIVLACGSLAASEAENRYRELKSLYVERISSVARELPAAGKLDEAKALREYLAPHLSGRLTCFLPAEGTAAKRPSSPLPPEAIAVLRKDYAHQLFALCRDQCAVGNGAIAYPWLFEVLREFPEHEEARRVLSPVIDAKRPVARVVPSAHARFGWPRGRHVLIETEHIALETNSSSKDAVVIAQILERFHTVWQQLFFNVGASPQKLQDRMAGRDVPISAPQKFRVVLFRDRDEYLRQLRKVSGIDVSSGIYLDEVRFSALYAGDDAKRSTWFHELTHQFFQEYWDAKPGVAQDRNMWQVEAVALFMETWRDCGDHVTLAGWDAENLQFARFRALGGDFYMPLARLAELGRTDLQQHPDIRKIYSEMAGLGQFFLVAEEARYRPAFLSALLSTYKRTGGDELAEQLAPDTYEEIDRRYLQYLVVTDEDILHQPPYAEMKQLSLRGTKVTDRGLAAFGICDQLEWIDLSATAAGDIGFEAFPVSDKLRQLFLEQTRITSAAARHMGEFRELRELYLSHTAINDDSLTHFFDLKRLKVLDLASCQVTDKGVDSLLKLSSLESLTLTGTQVSDIGRDRLRKKFPRLKIFVE